MQQLHKAASIVQVLITNFKFSATYIGLSFAIGSIEGRFYLSLCLMSSVRFRFALFAVYIY